jgi:UDP-3-O-[3-hydroxymyristoyl] glucosamine N-acyltransferase
MKFSAAQIAAMAGGRVEGDSEVYVSGFAKIEEAKAGQLAFLANSKYEEFLYTTEASIVIVNEALQLKSPVKASLIRVPDAYTAFAGLLTQYEKMQSQQLTGIEQPSFIHETASIGEQVYVGAFAYIGRNVRIGKGVKIYPQVYLGDNVQIGDNTVLFAGVKIYHHCEVGKNAIIHAGAVLGSDGFGFAPQADGTYQKVPQLGNVVVEDEVEIGANTTIDRATMGSTRIKSGAKIDNLVQLAHNVEIGSHTVIAAQTGISGSTKIGRYVMIGGQAGLAGHLHIGDGVKINAQTGIGKSLPPGKSYTGTPFNEYTAYMRSQAMVRRLPELESRIKELEAKLAERESAGRG